MNQNPYDPPRSPVADMMPGVPAAAQIYVTRDGQKMGPYSVAEIEGRLQSGAFSTADLAWREGMSEWVTLAGLLAGLQQPMPALPSTKSGLAKASLIIGSVMIAAWIATLIFAGVAYNAGARDDSGLMITVGLLVLGGLLVNGVGLILGLAAFGKPASNRTSAIIGVALNVFAVIGILFVMYIGMKK